MLLAVYSACRVSNGGLCVLHSWCLVVFTENAYFNMYKDVRQFFFNHNFALIRASTYLSFGGEKVDEYVHASESCSDNQYSLIANGDGLVLVGFSAESESLNCITQKP